MREALQEFAESYLAFHPGQRSAQAVVYPAPKRHVASGGSGQVEDVGIGKGLRIAVGGADQEEDLLPAPYLLAADLLVHQRRTAVDLHRAVESQHLLDSRVDETRVLAQTV